jgi:hypothetical protein
VAGPGVKISQYERRVVSPIEYHAVSEADMAFRMARSIPATVTVLSIAGDATATEKSQYSLFNPASVRRREIVIIGSSLLCTLSLLCLPLQGVPGA